MWRQSSLCLLSLFFPGYWSLGGDRGQPFAGSGKVISGGKPLAELGVRERQGEVGEAFQLPLIKCSACPRAVLGCFIF